MLKFAIVFKIRHFLSFSEFNEHYWPTKFFKSRRWVSLQNFREKNGFEFFYCEAQNIFLPFSVFCDLFTNNARKLEAAESNFIMENVPISLFLSVRVSSLLFLVHVFSFSHTISLFVDAAPQLLLCRVMSSYLIVISIEL